LGIGSDVFYDPKKVLLLPMGMCFPGTGKSGDLPPPSICAPTWHPLVFEAMEKANKSKAKNQQCLTLLIGSYAQKYYLQDRCAPTLTETVRTFKQYLPHFFPLVHPSPRNGIWLKKNPWFEEEVLPVLKKRVQQLV
jgi:uracil-DNA glycosylase